MRKLRVGDVVEEGQLLAFVNPALAIDNLAAKIAKLDASEADVKVAVKTKLEAEKRYDAAAYAHSKNAISADDYRAAKLAWDRYIEEEQAKRSVVLQAQAELKSVHTTLQMCEIRSSVRGTICGFAKRAGEGVKNLETVIRIEVADKARE